jgi:hypothetical protein
MRRQETFNGDERELAPVGIWADECQCWLTDFDIEAAERGRSSKLYHVYAWQSWGTLKHGYGGGQVGETKAEALAAVLGVRIMCQQKDRPTRDRNSAMCGTAEFWVPTDGTSTADDPQDGTGRVTTTHSRSLQRRPVLPEEAFLTLATGERAIVEAFIFMGTLFRYNGQRYLRVEFAQNWAGERWDARKEKKPRARPWNGFIEWTDVARAFLHSWQDGVLAYCKWINFWTDGLAYPDAPGGSEYRGQPT